MKVGDKLYCKKDYCNFFTYNKCYVIGSISERYFFMYDNDNELSAFNLHDESSVYYYKDWFYTEQEMRKLKLNKLNIWTN